MKGSKYVTCKRLLRFRRSPVRRNIRMSKEASSSVTMGTYNE